jgi:hypothetical protein
VPIDLRAGGEMKVFVPMAMDSMKTFLLEKAANDPDSIHVSTVAVNPSSYFVDEEGPFHSVTLTVEVKERDPNVG